MKDEGAGVAPTRVSVGSLPRAERLRLRGFLRPRRGTLLVAGILAIVQSALDLAQPWPLKFAVDNAIGHHPLPSWLGWLHARGPTQLALVAGGSLVAIVVLSGVVGYGESYMSGSAAQRIGASMRKAVFGRLLELSPRFHDAHRSGDLVTRLTSDVSDVKDALITGFTTLLPALVTLAGMLAITAMLDLRMAIAAFAVTPALALVVTVSRRKMKTNQREYRRLQGRVASRATEVIRHARFVQAFYRHREETERFGADVDAAVVTALQSIRLEAVYSPAADTVLAIGSATVLFIGIQRVSAGTMTLGALLVVLSYLGGIYSPVRSLARLATTLSRAAASRDRIGEVLTAPHGVPETDDPLPCTAPRDNLDVFQVDFSYNEHTPVLRRVRLNIPIGRRVCIVGPTGAGKTTLLSLLLRLYDPDRGFVLLDGVDVRRFALADLRAHMALVPQDPWILDGTIADNIEFGRPGATRAEVLAAGREALVDEFALRLPEGYDTVVGESGSMLSGGQRRRIALARAIVRGAEILLLDEPTSGLDVLSESQVMAAIERATRQRTAVIVTHQLRVATVADRIIVLENGQVAEEGDPASLLAAGGPFARMWDECRGSLAHVPDHPLGKEEPWPRDATSSTRTAMTRSRSGLIPLAVPTPTAAATGGRANGDGSGANLPTHPTPA